MTKSWDRNNLYILSHFPKLDNISMPENACMELSHIENFKATTICLSMIYCTKPMKIGVTQNYFQTMLSYLQQKEIRKGKKKYKKKRNF